ncbi:MAG: bifunctional riboflavin kinase/FAD synthetase [Snowella sp.]|nr:bifunctional riboflavin kinase/FAD synthetase [Snowella sp.]
MWIPATTTDIITPTAIALGNFDGVHLGHAQVLSQILDSSFDGATETVLQPTVVSFTPHPREFFSGQRQLLLTPLDEKVEQLEKLGIQQLVLLPFTQALARLSPQDFVEQIVVKDLKAQKVTVGNDFRFGYQRQGNVEDLQAIASQFGTAVRIAPLKTEGEHRISSSLIRAALAEGDVKHANQMLGRPYCLQGTVIDGKKLGRTLGFPTANLHLPETKLLPRLGVYCVEIFLKDIPQKAFGGVMNIGYRPTVGQSQVSVEVHLFDWAADLYGQSLSVNLLAFLRPEQKFASLEALKAQITQDCQQAHRILAAIV